MHRLTAIVVVILCGCGGGRGRGGMDAPTGSGGDGPATCPSCDAPGGNTGQVSIYAHDATTLYRVDPDTLQVMRVNAFDFGAFEQMTDLAIDSNGNLVGVSFTAVYKVDPATAHVTQLSSQLSRSYNGLSFVPASQVGLTGADVLIGTENQDGTVWRIDPMTGQATQIGGMGGSYVSSGDIVSVAGFGTVQTVKGSGPDVLVRLAPTTFAATPIGTDTGFSNIWGLGFWKGKVFGFTSGGEFITIDPATGQGHLVQGGGPSWFGAAVTTTAPVIP